MFSQRTHRIPPIGPEIHLLLHFLVSGCIWDYFVTVVNSVRNGLNWCNYCKSPCHEVASDVFATNAPDPAHWTLHSSFVVFGSVWVRLGPFRYGSKLSAKWAELVQLIQKFMPRSRVIIFRNERTRSTPLDRNLTFWCVL